MTKKQKRVLLTLSELPGHTTYRYKFGGAWKHRVYDNRFYPVFHISLGTMKGLIRLGYVDHSDPVKGLRLNVEHFERQKARIKWKGITTINLKNETPQANREAKAAEQVRETLDKHGYNNL